MYFSCESRSCSGHYHNDEHFNVSSSCISRGTENMPFIDCNENICVDVLSDVRQNQASVNCKVARPVSSDLKVKGINCGHLNIQGICGQNMSKFPELKLMLKKIEIYISLALVKRN